MNFEADSVLGSETVEQSLHQTLKYGIKSGNDVSFLLDESADVVTVKMNDVFVCI